MMGPNEKEVVRSDFYMYGSKLEDWTNLHDTNGNFIGTEHKVLGGTERYDEHGDLEYIITSNGTVYDKDGHLV